MSPTDPAGPAEPAGADDPDVPANTANPGAPAAPAAPPAVRLLGPVTLDSPVVPMAGVRLVVDDGQPALFDPAAGVSHPVSAGTGALFAAFDGRPLGELLDDADPALQAEAIELVRRLRALALVEDAAPPDATSPDAAPTDATPPGVTANSEQGALPAEAT